MVAATIMKKRKLTGTHLVAGGAPTPIVTLTSGWWDLRREETIERRKQALL
jgi:hypothetical protein